jgi:hypothetical protein
MQDTVQDLSFHTEQQTPQPNDLPSCWDLVIAEMHHRDRIGRERYGTPLQPLNGRNSLRDVSEELLDAIVYMRQFRAELQSLRLDLMEIQRCTEAPELIRVAFPNIKKANAVVSTILTKYPFLNAE